MADLPPLHAVTVVLRPTDAERPISVLPVSVLPQLTPGDQIGLLRTAAARLARQHGLNGADCLRDFLTTYPQPDLEGDL